MGWFLRRIVWKNGKLSEMVYISTGKHYEHYNRALGKQIRSKRQYDEELKKGGFISKDKADEITKKKAEKAPYKASPEVRRILDSCSKPDKNGNVKMSDRGIDALKNMGMSFDKDKIKKHIDESRF